MICLVTLHWNQRPGRAYLASPAGRGQAGRLALCTYRQLAAMPKLPRALYLCADTEVLKDERPLVDGVCARLREQWGDALVWNDSRTSLGRYDIIRKLHALGQTDFSIYRLSAGERPTRYPVFVRRELDHGGSRTELLHNAEDLERKVEEVNRTPEEFADWVATEYISTADADGVHRKYGAFCLGGEIIPRHLLAGRAWMLKEPEITSAAVVAEERDYLEGNPHREALAGIFAAANMRYGRVDYGVVNGRIQVWEINSNPVILRREHLEPGPRLANQQLFAQRFAQALERADPGGALPVGWAINAQLRQARFALGRAWSAIRK